MKLEVQIIKMNVATSSGLATTQQLVLNIKKTLSKELSKSIKQIYLHNNYSNIEHNEKPESTLNMYIQILYSFKNSKEKKNIFYFIVWC